MDKADDRPTIPPSRSEAEGQGSDELLSERAFRHLEEAIVTMRLAPGALLSETGIARELGIGRTPVREALQRLRLEGLVQVLPKRGVLVSDINPQQQLRLLELRRAVEGLMAGLAAQRATPAERAAFADLADRFAAARDGGGELAFMQADREFNLLLSQACHNEYCERVMASVHGLSRRFFFKYRAIANLSVTAENHRRVAEAVAAGDAGAAAEAMERLMDHNEDFTLRSLRH
ncbi:GntR family transcriptional regulator [Rubellimicrobium sp. CFH 75288]|uniref:GntR family transcriptional regulator n=1 Tax=Rubellimicrobium sp. CFH 75288 TaxID=2697034 RepID=UPI0014132F69|nr:GntR family transcriptional regulator [Rubellimicrobium sp. CFH 75288]NAZ37713.1 FCD domain-containing protein [Rubellimicrobium sp. CFH 75288]